MPEGDKFLVLDDGDFLYTPAEKTYGEKSFTIQFDDGYGGVAVCEVTASIARVVYPPTISQHDFTVNITDDSFEVGAFLLPFVTEDSGTVDEISLSDIELTQLSGIVILSRV